MCVCERCYVLEKKNHFEILQIGRLRDHSDLEPTFLVNDLQVHKSKDDKKTAHFLVKIPTVNF
jgi:hypothetical protein